MFLKFLTSGAIYGLKVMSYENSQYSIWKFRRFAGNDFLSNLKSEHVLRVLEAFEKS